MSRTDRLALLLSLCAVAAALLFGSQVFESIPHIEDEFTYIWQAQAAASGKLLLPSPSCPVCFTVPFVVDHQGQRFGKYPPGFPAILSLGIRFGARQLVNPLLAGMGMWLMYLLIKKVTDEPTALLAALLTLGSPFFLMNSSNLLSHAWSLVLSTALALAWLDTFSVQPRYPWLTASVAAFCLGALALTRPLTAVGVSLPFALHALTLLRRSSPLQRLRLISIAVSAIAIASLHFIWQFALTGNALLNPYTLWWPKDAVGFGNQIGYQEHGYHLVDVFINLGVSLGSGASDLFGWPFLSWLFLPFGIIALRRNKPARLISAVFLSLVLTYTLYWSGSWLFGPRYYYEGLFSLTLLSAAGIRWLIGFVPQRLFTTARKFAIPRRAALTGLLVIALTCTNVFFYLPQRASNLRNLYGASQADLAPFSTPTALAAVPALVFVHTANWNAYYSLLELNSAHLDTPFLIAYSLGEPGDQELAAHYPNRTVLHYYPENPGKFYQTPIP